MLSHVMLVRSGSPYIPSYQILRSFSTRRGYGSKNYNHNERSSIRSDAGTARPAPSQRSLRAQPITKQILVDKLNPPLATLTPVLSEPARGHLPAYKYYFRLGKSYLDFYKRGFRVIWGNYKLAKTFPVAPFSRSSDVEKAVREGKINRVSYVFAHFFPS